MVTQVVQPPQPVANCFQLLKLLGGTIKRPHMYGLREREIIIDIILCWYSLSKSDSPCLLHFPSSFQETLVSLRYTSLYMLSRMHSFGRSLSEARAGRIQTTVCEGLGRIRWSLLLITFVRTIYNTEVSCCSRKKRVSVCFNVWRIFIIQAFIMIYLMFYMNLTNI